MKSFLMSTLAIFFPWAIMLIDDNPGGALLAIILQATLIGWIPASMWACPRASWAIQKLVTSLSALGA